MSGAAYQEVPVLVLVEAEDGLAVKNAVCVRAGMVEQAAEGIALRGRRRLMSICHSRGCPSNQSAAAPQDTPQAACSQNPAHLTENMPGTAD